MAKVFIFSGAGLSAESGLATFRGDNSRWVNDHHNVACDYSTWKSNYPSIHQSYNLRRKEIGNAVPNSAHRMIANWQKRYETIILTQNIDDLLERAGCSDVIHLHGHVDQMHCTDCGHVWSIGYAAWGSDDHCLHCTAHQSVKPNVVFFNQEAPRYRDLSRALYALRDDDVVLVTGTNGAVIDIHRMLDDRTGYKIFNGLEAPFRNVYDRLLLQPATEAFLAIDLALRELLG